MTFGLVNLAQGGFKEIWQDEVDEQPNNAADISKTGKLTNISLVTLQVDCSELLGLLINTV